MILKTELFQYQKEAVNKLLPIRIGALYMEMGTGKTRTALEMIKRRLDAGKLTKVIWLCPCSVKGNLRSDLDKHADGWKDTIEVCGIETLSTSVSENSRLLSIVTSNTCMMIVDESNLIKNSKALRTRHITMLAENCRYRMILNGTPISKTYADLYAQWFLLDWRILGYKSFYSFAANHVVWDQRVRGKIKNCINVDYLVEKIDPYSYQVKKDDVMQLPDKHYFMFWFFMTYDQETHYDYVTDWALEQLDEQEQTTIYRMFHALEEVTSGRYVKVGKHIENKPFFDDVEDNPRIRTLITVLDKIGNEKAIIYCKFLHEVSDILKVLKDDAISFTGCDSQKQREINLAAFAKEKQYLVTLKSCGAYGLNLQYCHNVVYYNNDWDFATRSQSEDRVHRLGQTEEVNIYDICADRSLDVRIKNCLRKKSIMVKDFKDEMKKVGKSGMKSWLKGEKGEEEILER